MSRSPFFDIQLFVTVKLILLLQVRYTGYRDRPMEERQVRFQNSCREGQVEIAFAATGTNLQLVFGNACGTYPPDRREDCDFDKEHGKVRISKPNNESNLNLFSSITTQNASVYLLIIVI